MHKTIAVSFNHVKGNGWVFNTLSTIFHLYRGGQFYCWSTRRKPQTCRKSTDKLYHLMLYSVHLQWGGFELTTLVVIGADCTDKYDCKFNYHTITTTTALIGYEQTCYSSSDDNCLYVLPLWFDLNPSFMAVANHLKNIPTISQCNLQSGFSDENFDVIF